MTSLKSVFYALLTLVLCTLSITANAQDNPTMVPVFLSPSPAEGGKIECVGKDGKVYRDYPQEIAVGTEVTVTITPNPGFRISYIDCNGTEYQEDDGSLEGLLNGGKVAVLETKAGDRKLRVACNFSESEDASPVISIEQPEEKLGRIEVVDFYTKAPITTGQTVNPEDQIQVTAFEYDNARIKTLYIGEQKFTRDELDMDSGATKSVDYTVKGDTKIYCEYDQEAGNAITLTWDVPAPEEGSIAVLNSASGTQLTNGAQLEKGSMVNIIVTPKEGYKVESVAVGTNFYLERGLIPIEGGARLVKATLTEDTRIAVQFVPAVAPSYVVNFTCPKEVESLVTITCNGEVFSSGSTAKEGDKIQFSLAENDDYVVKFWRVNGYTQSPGNPVLTLSMPNAKLDVELVVTQSKRYKVDFNDKPVGGMLVVTCDGAAVDPGTKILAGKTILFTAVPADGYVIDEWLHNNETVNGREESYRVIVGADFKVEVKFALIKGISDKIQGKEAPCVRYLSSEEAWLLDQSGLAWQLLSLEGCTLASGSSERIDATRLASGVYLLRVGAQTIKLVKP